MSDKKSPQSKDSNKRIPQNPLIEVAVERSASSQLSLDHSIGIPPELPNLANTATILRQLIQRLRGQLGNAAVVRRMADKGKRSDRASLLATPGFLQRDGEEEHEGEGDSGAPAAAAGAATIIQNGTEAVYDISGAALNDIPGQLAHFAGLYGAQTETHLVISTNQTPVERHADGSVGVGVPWSINCAVVGIPRWTDSAEACDAAQQEWDRFMRKVRQHEQEAHVDMTPQFARDLGAEDRVVTGADTGELRNHLAAEQQELRDRMQTLHDGRDHGVSIDPILHPDNGRCN